MGPRVRHGMILPGVLALAVALMVFAAPVVAPAPVEAAAPTQRAAKSPDASQATTRLRVVNHNIEKRLGALERALEIAASIDAPIITLQEVCSWQADQLIAEHPQWTISWKPERNRNKCRHNPPAEDALLISQRKVGNIAIWTGGPGGAASTFTFGAQRVDSDRAGLACVTWVDGIRHHACSAHLIPPADRREAGVRTKQARGVRRIADRWIARDDLVVLGGDFNAVPSRKTMGYLYTYRGMGSFRESTSRTLGGSECRCRQGTMDGRKRKIDYVFFSANRLKARDYRALRIVKTASDHHLLVGWADVDASAR